MKDVEVSWKRYPCFPTGQSSWIGVYANVCAFVGGITSIMGATCGDGSYENESQGLNVRPVIKL